MNTSSMPLHSLQEYRYSFVPQDNSGVDLNMLDLQIKLSCGGDLHAACFFPKQNVFQANFPGISLSGHWPVAATQDS